MKKWISQFGSGIRILRLAGMATKGDRIQSYMDLACRGIITEAIPIPAAARLRLGYFFTQCLSAEGSYHRVFSKSFGSDVNLDSGRLNGVWNSAPASRFGRSRRSAWVERSEAPAWTRPTSRRISARPPLVPGG